MRICILTSTIKEGYGGWARYSLEVVKELQTRTNTEVITITEDDSSIFNIKKIDSNLSFIKNIIPNVLYVRKIAKNSEVIHALDGYPYAITAYLATWGRKNPRVFITGIGTYTTTPLSNIYFGWLLKLAYQKAIKIFCISNFTADKLKKLIPLPNIEVVHMGADQDILHAIPTYEDEQNIPNDFILSVGDLKPRKGYHISIPAFARLSQSQPHLYYIIVGYQFNTEYFKRLQQLTIDNHITDKVIFLSAISDQKLHVLYRRAKLLILSSINDNKHYEGFGLVYIEAGLFGVPAIGSKDCGAEDAIIDHETGYLITQNNIELLADKIDTLISDENKRKKMGENAQRFADQFKWSRTIDAYLKGYNSL